MSEIRETDKRAAGATEKSKAEAEAKGKVLEFLWYLKKQGRLPITIKGHSSVLNTLIRRGVNVLDPEKVKEHLAVSNLKNSSKRTIVIVYQNFLKFLSKPWQPPTYRSERSIPFIPSEAEIDLLITCSGKRLAAFLQLLKETGMRAGEAEKLKWIDIDFERRIINVKPEKGSNPRLLPISPKLVSMLKALPKKKDQVFSTLKTLQTCFWRKRRSLAIKTNNPRLLRIHFHTLRHWKATMEYHKTKDPWHVKQLLGHKSIRSTEIYINIEQAIFQTTSDEFHVKVAEKPEEIKKLLEVGFEYICTKDGLMFFRKRK